MPDIEPGRASSLPGRLPALAALAAAALVGLAGAPLLSLPPLQRPGTTAFAAMLAAALAAGYGCGLALRNRMLRLERELAKTSEREQLREHERDLAQEELIRRLQEERELARRKVQFEGQLAEYEKYAALAQLALGAAHEINNPLLGILSHLELELKDTTRVEEREEIEQCIEGARRITHTMRGLLNYARPAPLMLARISLERVVDDTLSFLQHQPMLRNKTLEKKISPDLPQMTVDANQLSQMLMNLLLNAAEATPEGGVITIAAEKVKLADFIEIRISDTGHGIPADILPHVFEPFFTTKRGRGTGLGLSITQSYARGHGGEIHIESLPAIGTTVRITLPTRQQERPMPQLAEVVV